MVSMENETQCSISGLLRLKCRGHLLLQRKHEYQTLHQMGKKIHIFSQVPIPMPQQRRMTISVHIWHLIIFTTMLQQMFVYMITCAVGNSG